MSHASPAPLSPRRRNLAVDDYMAGVRAGDVTILARTLTLVESSKPQHQLLAEQVLNRLLPFTGRSIRLGVSGVPGAGKSTFIEVLGLHLLEHQHRVAVLAVDPSSSITGGSILGDKTRMTHLASHADAFIRPSPAAGTLGGVARKTRESMLVCEAAGYDIVLVETVGVGQSETMVADMTDCFLALMLTGAGDELQGIKRGLLELVDIIVVNKADGENRRAAELTARQYRAALELFASRGSPGSTPVLTCSALENEGVLDVWRVIERRTQRLKSEGAFDARRRQQNLQWLWAIVEERLKQAVHKRDAVQRIRDDLERKVLAGEIAVETAARQILEACGLSCL